MTQTVRRTDQDLQKSITEELSYTPSIDAASVKVLARDGAVTLSGEVHSLPERFEAKHAAMRVRGVKTLSDELTVHIPGSFSTKDDDIAKAAKTFLDWAVDVPANAIKAEVKDRKITLFGSVNHNYQRDAAKRAVMFIKGIAMIDNKISLKQTPPVSGVKAAVEAAMLRNAQLDAEKITVEVTGSKLMLRGSVRSWSEYREAEYAASAANGVTHVNNELVVTS